MKAITSDRTVIEIAVLKDTELNTDAEMEQSGYAVGKFLKSVSCAPFISGIALALRETVKISCGRAALGAEGK
jgi:hypothetical protein